MILSLVDINVLSWVIVLIPLVHIIVCWVLLLRLRAILMIILWQVVVITHCTKALTYVGEYRYFVHVGSEGVIDSLIK